jgi:carbon-monoxide dehydrogenase large subunit
MKFGVGQPVRRKEDVRLVTGHGRYTDDIALEGQGFAFFVRSPHAHAAILSIDAEPARAAPGVVGVFTAKDFPGTGTMPVRGSFNSRDGTPLRGSPKPLLATDKVRFVGEAVAMIVAETPGEAKDAADLVLVDYDPLAASGTLETAGEGADIWEGAPGNLAFDWADGDEAAVEAAFAKAARIVAVELVQNRIAPSPMEPRGAIGVHDALSGHYTLTTSTQGGSTIRDRVAQSLLHIPSGQLRVVTPDVGGGFGMKASVVAEQALVLLAAKALGRPVKWTGERMEAFLADGHARDVIMKGEMALDEDARILAIRLVNRANMGAYMSHVGPYIPTVNLRVVGSTYRVPAVHVAVKGYFTNTASVTSYRGAGRPEAIYVTERLMDQAALAFGLDRVEIRKRNLIAAKELPYRNWKGLSIDSGDFAANLEEAARRADWAGFGDRRAASLKAGRLRGLGVACYFEASGGPPGPEPGALRFTDDGKVEVLLATQTNGQGHETTYAQLVTERLGMAFEDIVVRQGDTDSGLSGGGTVGSRSLQTAGNALAAAADGVIVKGKLAAGQVLQAGGAAVTFAVTDGVGEFAVTGTARRISVAELAVALRRDPLPGFENGLDESAAFESPPTFPNGCHMCEIEVDPETGTCAILAYTIVDDVGRVINPMIVDGQVHGGVAQGLGQALLEHCLYDAASGQLMTASFADYAMPRASDMPALDLSYNEIPCRTNPIGAKGAGEAGTIGALPAIIGALSDALGVAHIDMPATPEKIWRAAQARA